MRGGGEGGGKVIDCRWWRIMRDQGLNTSNNWLLHFVWKKTSKKTLLSQVYVYYNVDGSLLVSKVQLIHTDAGFPIQLRLSKEKLLKGLGHEIEFKYLEKKK